MEVALNFGAYLVINTRHLRYMIAQFYAGFSSTVFGVNYRKLKMLYFLFMYLYTLPQVKIPGNWVDTHYIHFNKHASLII
jgi:hypothetical protein